MTTIKRIGWILIYASLVSWGANAVTASALSIKGELDLTKMLVWTYCTLPVLIVGIFMAQYEPFNEEQ